MMDPILWLYLEARTRYLTITRRGERLLDTDEYGMPVMVSKRDLPMLVLLTDVQAAAYRHMKELEAQLPDSAREQLRRIGLGV